MVAHEIVRYKYLYTYIYTYIFVLNSIIFSSKWKLKIMIQHECHLMEIFIVTASAYVLLIMKIPLFWVEDIVIYIF